MRELGGPTPTEKIPQIHARRLKSVIAKTVWYLTIVPDLDGGPAGTIGIWETDWEGSKINEMGWMILPAFQGRGLATLAGRMILDRARAEQHCREINAFPSIHNGASNTICRKLGFSLLREVAVAYNGPPQPSNHWKIELDYSIRSLQ
jgi:RimJ/RimL family protein N-acetyltransferase